MGISVQKNRFSHLWISLSHHISFVGLSVWELALTGLLVLKGSMWVSGGTLHSRSAALAIIALAILLGIVGIATASGGSGPEQSTSHASRRMWWAVAALMVLHGGIAVQHLRVVPADDMDCFTFQRYAAMELTQGINPYGKTQADIYDAYYTKMLYGPGMVINGRVQVGFQYPPVTFLCALPGYLLGDVRYGYVAAIMLSAIFVFALAPDIRGLFLVAFVLLRPVAFFIESESFTEPLVWMLLCATLYVAVKKPRWLPLTLGLFLASKQYNFLALPFLGFLIQPFSWRAYWKLLGMSLAVGLATVLPFTLLNFHALWHDLVLFHLAQPPRLDSLSFGVAIPAYRKAGLLILVIFIALGVWHGANHAAMFAAAYGMALLLFVSASKQAFGNYYFLIALSFLLAAATLWPAPKAHTLHQGIIVGMLIVFSLVGILAGDLARWSALTIFTTLVFGFFVVDNHRYLLKGKFWMFTASLLALHLVVFVFVLLNLIDWTLIWFAVMLLELQVLAGLRSAFLQLKPE